MGPSPYALPSQRHSPSPTPDYGYESPGQSGFADPKGSIRYQSFSHPASRYQSPLSLSPSLSSAPLQTPPILSQALRQRQHYHNVQRRIRQTINPIYLNSQFRLYREKQDQKKCEEPKDQKWPAVLEDAFLDGE